MQTSGSHVLADVWVNEYTLGSNVIEKIVADALDKSGMTVLGSKIHDFGGGAFTGVWLLAESHFSIHTFPERNFISLDCYTCGNEGNPLSCVSTFINGLDVKNMKLRFMERGI